MSVAVFIPALASVSVLQYAAVGGSVVGVVGPLYTFGELNSCELGVFEGAPFVGEGLGLLLNKHS